MRVLTTVVGAAVIGLGAPVHAADQLIDLTEFKDVPVAYLHQLAEYALSVRRYNIEENTPTLLVGEQDKKKVEILIEPGKVQIRWKEGFGNSKDQWLRNIKTSMLWRMAE
jgi:hypothetical protein